MADELATLCPLMVQGLMANPIYLQAKPEERGALLGAAKCIEAGCGFWTEIAPHEDEPEEGEEKEPAEVVEACGVSLMPAMIADAASAFSDVEDSLESLNEVQSATQKVLEMTALAAAAKLEVDLAEVMQSAQQVASEMEAAQRGQAPQG